MTAKYLETIEVDPRTLRSFPGNPNKGDAAAVGESLRANGQYRSVVVRRLQDGELQILAGHTTRSAAVGDGVERLRVEVIECTDREARRIVLADNRTAQLGKYDDDALMQLLDKVNADGGLAGTAWKDEEFRELVDRTMAAEGFSPDEGDQPRLDKLKEVTCPSCGHVFEPSGDR